MAINDLNAWAGDRCRQINLESAVRFQVRLKCWLCRDNYQRRPHQARAQQKYLSMPMGDHLSSAGDNKESRTTRTWNFPNINDI